MKDEEGFSRGIYDLLTEARHVYNQHGAQESLVVLVEGLSRHTLDHEVLIETEDDIMLEQFQCCDICNKKFDKPVPEDVLHDIKMQSMMQGHIFSLHPYPVDAHVVCLSCHTKFEARMEHKAKFN